MAGQWLISAAAVGSGVCPDCGKRSTRRYGWHERHLQDLPAQGAPVAVKLRLQRWRCRNEACERKTFTALLPDVAAPRARRTERPTEIIYLLGHGVGGRPGERLIKRIGMPTSDDTILRCLKRRVKARRSKETARVVGVDNWAWRKGSTYGTIIVDLERREVLDLFPERAAGMTADWLKRHPGVEIISRDRCGSFAQGAHEGAPQARQIADRFHILQNLREAVQAQLGRAAGFSARPLLPADGEEVASVRDKHGGAEHRRLTRVANERSRQAVFDRVRALRREGRNVMDIARQTGFDRRTVAKWIRAEALPQRSASAPKTTSPWHFEDYLSRRWSEGCVRGRRLFQEIKARGYTGSFSNLERLLAKWRNPKRKTTRTAPIAPRTQPLDPATGRSISPIVAAALCIKPRGLLTVNQAAKVDAMKKDWPEFATMRRLAMRFRGLIKSKSATKLGSWLRDAQSGLYAMQRFARCATSAIVPACNRSGHDRRATRQPAIPKTESNARRPPPKGYDEMGTQTNPYHRG
ncbi:ISL3 family transposase [Methylocystis sp. IM3]